MAQPAKYSSGTWTTIPVRYSRSLVRELRFTGKHLPTAQANLRAFPKWDSTLFPLICFHDEFLFCPCLHHNFCGKAPYPKYSLEGREDLFLWTFCVHALGILGLSADYQGRRQLQGWCVLIRYKLLGKGPSRQHWVQWFAVSHPTSAWEWKAQFAGIHWISLCLDCPVFQRCPLLPMDYIYYIMVIVLLTATPHLRPVCARILKHRILEKERAEGTGTYSAHTVCLWILSCTCTAQWCGHSRLRSGTGTHWHSSFHKKQLGNLSAIKTRQE